MTEPWPVAELDPVGRLRVLARLNPVAVYAEQVLPLPVEQVWATAADLETVMPQLLTDVRSFTVLRIDGEVQTALARGRLGQRALFTVTLRPGWCWMQSRFLLGGFAATPHGDGTLVAFCGGFRPVTARFLAPAVRRLGDPLANRVISRLERLTAADSSAG